MASVRFAWSPLLVELRREVCPQARWVKKGRQWIMQEEEARRFLTAAQARLEFQRGQAKILVDDTTWVVGFVQGAPYRITDVGAA